MFSQRVGRVMAMETMLALPARTSVADAARQMADHGVSAVLVVEGSALAGIFTERDAVKRVVAQGLDVHQTCLAAVMTAAPRTVDPDKTYGYALNLMHVHGLRHLPVVENGRPVGIVSQRGALDPEMEEFVSESRRREGLS